MEHTNVDMNCESCINDSGLDMDVLFDLPNLLDFTFKPDTIGKWSFNVCPHHGLFTLYTQKRCMEKGLTLFIITSVLKE